MGCIQSGNELQGLNDFTQHYEIGPQIGQGSFGQVWEATNRETRQVRAVKVLDIYRSGDRGKAQTAAWEEERAWKRVGYHENVVELISVFSGDRNFLFIMERCEDSLMDRLPSITGSDDAGLRSTLRQMLKGVAAVHRRRVVHRDVKPSNFLCGGSDGRTIKLCDFGMAAVETRNGELLRGMYGTTPYMSPEMVGAMGHDRSTDIWSFGATAYVMIFGDFPYAPNKRSHKDIKIAILYGVPSPSFQSVKKGHKASEATVSFIRSMMQHEPCQRRTAEQLLRAPYLGSGEQEKPKSSMRSNSTASLDKFDGSMSMASTETGGTRLKSITQSMSLESLMERIGTGSSM